MFVKIEKFIFYLFIIALPFQTRVILKIWGSSFNEWTSAFLYGTDLLLFLIFILWVGRSKTIFDLPSFKKISRSNIFLLVFLIISALSLVVADHLVLGVYRLIKILEFVGLYYYTRSSVGKVITLAGLFSVVMISAFFQSIIAIWQSLFQHNLGLKWLGETVLRTNFSGVAVVSWTGGKFLRAYGTTPHPNVLASWLFLGIFAFCFLFLHIRENLMQISSQGRSGYSFYENWIQKLIISKIFGKPFLLTIYATLLFGLFFTFSRVSIGLLLLGFIIGLFFVWLKRNKPQLNKNKILKKHIILLSIITLGVMFIFGFLYWPQVHSRIFISGQEQAVTQRVFYLKIAKEVILKRPWLGVGLGQFVPQMMALFKNYPNYFYQPVHNIYLLIMDEIGFLGLTAFLGWLASLVIEYRQTTKFREFYQISFFLVFICVLAMGLFDHFLWTLQQGQLIFWMTLGIIPAFHKLEKVI